MGRGSFNGWAGLAATDYLSCIAIALWKAAKLADTLPENRHSQILGFRTYHNVLEPQENLEGLAKLMKRMPVAIIILLLAALAGGVGMLATWDIPAPVTTVEKVLPDERFPR